MLIGEYSYSLDPKGRVNVPSKFRSDLGESFIATRGSDECLFIFSLEEWEKFVNKVEALPLSKAKIFQRHFFSGAFEAKLDKQGRILLPAPLREFAKLTKEVVISGAGKRVEIWSQENYAKLQNTLTYETIENAMEEIGF